MRDDQEINMNDRKYKVMDDGSLMIKNLENNDNGYYECMVKSPEGVVKSRPARMVVRSITVNDENGKIYRIFGLISFIICHLLFRYWFSDVSC